MEYEEFLRLKIVAADPCGRQITDSDVNPMLYPFQRDIVRWAVHCGRAALFEDCGLGKTFQQLEWARLVSKKATIIFTPLAVSHQTKKEAAKLSIEARVVADQAECEGGINISNYEKLHHFDPVFFDAIVLDESSILKSFDGVYRKQLTEFASSIPYRLACTATPAPNDLIELINHSEFLDVMTGKEILALFFIQDGNTTHKWRLKNHARRDFWKWLASWAVAIRMPEDLGYANDLFQLPPLNIHDVVVPGKSPRVALFDLGNLTLSERRKARQLSIDQRVAACADLVNESDEPWLVWCDLNAESAALAKAIPDAVEVKGADSVQHKTESLLNFSDRKIRVLVSKPSIAGHGMNWQHCSNVAFVGLSDSFEAFYQAVRRCWRFGQQNPVDCYIITSRAEGAVRDNVERKEKQAAEMMASLVKEMKGLSIKQVKRQIMDYEEDKWSGKDWTLYQGDSVNLLDEIDTDSIGMSVFSPPFPGMYAYTNSAHDMGNVKDIEEMISHFRFMAPKLLRVHMPGRSCCIHLTQVPAFKSIDGYIGLKDFRGAVIRMMEEEGWIFYGEVTIDKDPQVKAIRTKDRGLLFKTLAKDSSHMHMALADYLLQFRKPGDSPEPIKAGISKRYDNPDGWISSEQWIEWAAPVWYRQMEHWPGGIRETDVLENYRRAKDADDEKHLCPLQLGVIERAIKLWSNPGDVILDPFTGIGSVGFQAVKYKRRFVGIELKESYARVAVRNLQRAENMYHQKTLMDMMEQSA